MKPVCWWCCYPFEWESLHFPYEFTSNTFHTVGHFCSWGCMKSYGINRGKFEACDFITLLRKRMEGKIKPIAKAPSRYCLQMFGGSVSIDDYRKGIPIHVNIPGEIFHDTIASKDEKFEPTKLKREKPLERNKGKLETCLGIIRKCPVADREKKK